MPTKQPTTPVEPIYLFPPQPSGAKEKRVADLAARVSRTLGVARALAENGRELDLSGIEDGVGILCAQTLDLPSADARCMLPVLCEVLAQVDSLSAALRKRGQPD